MPPARPVLPDDLVLPPGSGGRIVLLVLDGLGGLPDPERGRTALEAARTPHLDELAGRSSLGLHHPVAPGITPGSGPGHLALFGYDPLEYQVGRGALSALGVGFPLRAGDVAIRLNLATLDEDGRITDRRAGRPSDAEALRVVERLRAGIDTGRSDVEFFLEPEKEHRVVLVFRGPGLGARLADTDPQTTGVPPLEPRVLPGEEDAASERTVAVLSRFVDRAREILSDEPVIRGVLARGFALYEGFPSVTERFGLRAAAWARYPMYRGVARLVGMEAPLEPESDEAALRAMEGAAEDFDFHFLHLKSPDARGEDGDFPGRVAALEAADAWIPRILAAGPRVLLVTGDHSTPAPMKAHSWHSVPVLLHSPHVRTGAGAFHETACRTGDLGTLEARHLMTLALAHAGRLAKYGA